MCEVREKRGGSPCVGSARLRQACCSTGLRPLADGCVPGLGKLLDHMQALVQALCRHYACVLDLGSAIAVCLFRCCSADIVLCVPCRAVVCSTLISLSLFFVLLRGVCRVSVQARSPSSLVRRFYTCPLFFECKLAQSFCILPRHLL